MTTTAAIADHLGLLDKERIIAPADYNRWLVPACSSRHSSLHWHGLRLQRVLEAAARRALRRRRQGGSRMLGRSDHVRREDGGHAAGALHHELQLEPVRSRLDVHPVLRVARHLCRNLGRLARAGWATQSRRSRCLLLERWLSDFGTRRLYPPALADVAWLGHNRRLRSRPRLHLAGLDPDKMVP